MTGENHELHNQTIVHLQMIQGVIDRMARNSFLLKGWGVTIASAALVLMVGAAESSIASLVWLVPLPVLAFWCLDAYYLCKERVFRSRYDTVRKITGPSDFSMERSDQDEPAGNWGSAFVAPVVALFYAPAIGVLIIFAVTIMQEGANA